VSAVKSNILTKTGDKHATRFLLPYLCKDDRKAVNRLEFEFI